jgi:hypothetical protein
LDESIHGEHAYETLEVEELFNGDHGPHATNHTEVGKENGLKEKEHEWELVGPRK